MESVKNMKFKTNINCGGCLSAVKPHLDNNAGITSWSVDTDDADKILTVHSTDISEDDIMQLIRKIGFTIEPLQEA